jgi:glutamyl-Q tRNA(Asp) synthetase
LYRCFKQPQPLYYHLPLVKNAQGVKFSKRAGSEAIEPHKATELLLMALEHLGQDIERSMCDAKPSELLSHFIKDWKSERLIKHESN